MNILQASYKHRLYILQTSDKLFIKFWTPLKFLMKLLQISSKEFKSWQIITDFLQMSYKTFF